MAYFGRVKQRALSWTGDGQQWGFTQLWQFACTYTRILHRSPTLCSNVLHFQDSIGKYTCPAHHQQHRQTFFIFRRIGSSVADICEWRLIRVALTVTMSSSYPSCLEDSKYVIDFSVLHPSNFRYNLINRCFWLQYHGQDNLLGPCSSLDTHLICPSDTSKA